MENNKITNVANLTALKELYDKDLLKSLSGTDGNGNASIVNSLLGIKPAPNMNMTNAVTMTQINPPALKTAVPETNLYKMTKLTAVKSALEKISDLKYTPLKAGEAIKTETLLYKPEKLPEVKPVSYVYKEGDPMDEALATSLGLWDGYEERVHKKANASDYGWMHDLISKDPEYKKIVEDWFEGGGGIPLGRFDYNWRKEGLRSTPHITNEFGLR